MSLAPGTAGGHRLSDSQGQVVPLLATPLLSLLWGTPGPPGLFLSLEPQPAWPPFFLQTPVSLAGPPTSLPALPHTRVLR